MQALLAAKAFDLPLHRVNVRDWLDRLLGHLALTGLVQVVEFAPGVRPAADLGDLACRSAHE